MSAPRGPGGGPVGWGASIAICARSEPAPRFAHGAPLKSHHSGDTPPTDGHGGARVTSP
jgi:hypothetical protein